jgi:hypothetical protein
VRLRDGAREVEVTGSPAFIRQTIDDLPALFARMMAASVATPASISIPAAHPAPTARDEGGDIGVAGRAEPSARSGSNGGSDRRREQPAPPQTRGSEPPNGSPEERVFAVLRSSGRALTVASIRAELNDGLSGQQVRRILERSGQVIAGDEKPSRYRLR